MQSQEWCRRLVQLTPLLGSQFTKSWSVLLLLILCRLWDFSSCIPLLNYPVTCKAIKRFSWVPAGHTEVRRCVENSLGTFTGLAYCMPGSLAVYHCYCTNSSSGAIGYQFSTYPLHHVCGHAPLYFGYLENRSWTPGYEMLIRCL